MRLSSALIFVALLLATPLAQAVLIPVGYLSFDVFIEPGPLAPGVNSWSVGNMTGDPGSGGASLPPSFPILSPMVFQNSVLVLQPSGDAELQISLGNIGPGFATPISLQFSDAILFLSAQFTATVDAMPVVSDSGGQLWAAKQDIVVTLNHSGSLLPGHELAIAYIQADVPEPSTMVLVVIVAGLLPCFRRCSRAARRGSGFNRAK